METLAETEFYPRFMEQAIREALTNTPVVCLVGPRQSGKTTLVKQMFPKRQYLSFDLQSTYLLASEDADGLIQSLPDTVTIDEVQRVPEVINAIKYAVDQNRRPRSVSIDRLC